MLLSHPTACLKMYKYTFKKSIHEDAQRTHQSCFHDASRPTQKLCNKLVALTDVKHRTLDEPVLVDLFLHGETLLYMAILNSCTLEFQDGMRCSEPFGKLGHWWGLV